MSFFLVIESATNLQLAKLCRANSVGSEELRAVIGLEVSVVNVSTSDLGIIH